MAELLTNYYENRMALKAAGDWCYKRVHEQPYTWPYVQQQMLSSIEELLSKPAEQETGAFKGFGTPARIN
jgi:hypothetical protein